MPENREFTSGHEVHEGEVRSTSEETNLFDGQSPRSDGWFGRHAWPLTASFAILITAMASSLWWYPLMHHGSGWVVPSDIWNTYRAAQYVGWGFEGEIYKSQTFFDSFPGIAVLLAPIAKFAGAFHLSANFRFGVTRPTTWLILGPANAILGSVLLFPLDSLARRLQIPYGRRTFLVWLEAGLIFATAVMWGHPEYTLALAFAIYGLMATFDGKWVRVGIFMGIALLFQPLTALIMPLIILYLPARRWVSTASIVALPSTLLLIPPLVKEWRATTFTLLRQPNFPSVDHPTPWLSLAPVLQRSHVGIDRVLKVVTKPNGTSSLEYVKVHIRLVAVVSAGPGRLVALLLACAIGVYVAKTKPSLPMIVWWVAVCLSLRCVFECVMNPYYLLPAGAVILLLGATLSISRFIACTVTVAACTVVSYQFVEPWAYYASVIGLLVVALASARPREHSSPQLSSNVGMENRPST